MAREIISLIQRLAILGICAAFLSLSCSGSGDLDSQAETKGSATDSTPATVTDVKQSTAADHFQEAAECKEIADALTPFTPDNIEQAIARYSDKGDSQGLAERLSKCDNANGLSAEAAAYVLPPGTHQVEIKYEYGPESQFVKGPTRASAFLVGSNRLLASVELIGMGGGGRSEPLTIQFAETQFSDSGSEVYKGVLKFHWDTGDRFRSDRLLGHQLLDVFQRWPR